MCFSSILIDQEKYDAALKVLNNGISICNQHVLEKILIKLQLMKASVNIITQGSKNCQDKIEKELSEIEKNYKAANILGEVWYLRAINGII